MRRPDRRPALVRTGAEPATRSAGRFLYEEVVAAFREGRDGGVCGPSVRHARLRLIGLLDGAGFEPDSVAGMADAFAAAAMRVLVEDWEELRALVDDARGRGSAPTAR